MPRKRFQESEVGKKQGAAQRQSLGFAKKTLPASAAAGTTMQRSQFISVCRASCVLVTTRSQTSGKFVCGSSFCKSNPCAALRTLYPDSNALQFVPLIKLRPPPIALPVTVGVHGTLEMPLEMFVSFGKSEVRSAGLRSSVTKFREKAGTDESM